MTTRPETVLVTGGSGFIGTRAVLRLLAEGYLVRATVRKQSRELDVMAALKNGGLDNVGDKLSFFVADLQADAGWRDAVDGCDHVLHVASPFPPTSPKHEDELIVPAREGTLRVLRAARDADARRVVLTSSLAAVAYGHESHDEPFDELSWTNLDGRSVSAYAKSKTLAERAAWEFVEHEGGSLELAVINPVAVFGPLLAKQYSTSTNLIKRLIDGAAPGCPDLSFGVVDVRDVVDLHVRAMTNPAAAGERFICSAGESMTIFEMASTLKKRLGDDASRVPTRRIPNWIVRLGAIIDAEMRSVLPELGEHKHATSQKARTLLNWEPRSREDAIVATAQSMLRLGLLRSSN